MRILKALLFVVLFLVVVAAVAVGAVWFRAEQIIGARVQLPAMVFDASGADATRGKHFATGVVGCTNCHGQNLAGGPFIADAAFAILNVPNLTKGAGGVGARYSDADFERAIRHGVRPDGSKLMIMPSTAYQYMSDQDLRDVIAFVRSSPPIANAVKPRQIGPVGHVLIALGKNWFPADRVDQTASHPATQRRRLTSRTGATWRTSAAATSATASISRRPLYRFAGRSAGSEHHAGGDRLVDSRRFPANDQDRSRPERARPQPTHAVA